MTNSIKNSLNTQHEFLTLIIINCIRQTKSESKIYIHYYIYSVNKVNYMIIKIPSVNFCGSKQYQIHCQI